MNVKKSLFASRCISNHSLYFNADEDFIRLENNIVLQHSTCRKEMLNEMQSVDETQIRNLSPCLLMYRMFLLQQGINHTRKTKARRIKNVAQRLTKIGKLERISNTLRDTSLLAQQAAAPDRPAILPDFFSLTYTPLCDIKNTRLS